MGEGAPYGGISTQHAFWGQLLKQFIKWVALHFGNSFSKGRYLIGGTSFWESLLKRLISYVAVALHVRKSYSKECSKSWVRVPGKVDPPNDYKLSFSSL